MCMNMKLLMQHNRMWMCLDVVLVVRLGILFIIITDWGLVKYLMSDV